MRPNRLDHYLRYHYEMQRRGDLDPQYPALQYLARRYELNLEQRYWIAFLFACCYCVPTVFYVYNEFPDFENVDVARLGRWWALNKKNTLFQTDRLRIKTSDLLVETFLSYRNLVGSSQSAKFLSLKRSTPQASYRAAYDEMMKVRNFGRYTMFLYLEAVYTLTGFDMSPDRLDMKNALSSRNGLCYALGYDELLDRNLSAAQYAETEAKFLELVRFVRLKNPNRGKPTTVWNVETTLCAFKKLMRGTRYMNYYIDRQHHEIEKLEGLVRRGVDWSVLWDHRAEHFEKRYLLEFGAGEERKEF